MGDLVSLRKQTPDEWLLAQFDKHGRRLRTNHIRPMFELLDDLTLNGQASWPDPSARYDLDQHDRWAGAFHPGRVVVSGELVAEVPA